MLERIDNSYPESLVTIVVDDTAYHRVSTERHLELAIASAEGNGLNDVIQVAQGSYSGHFTFESQEDFDISIFGGYGQDFTVRTTDPSLTIFESGGLNIATNIALNTDTNHVVIDGFTFQNSSSELFEGVGSAVAIVFENGSVTVSNNIFHNNEIDGKGGAVGIVTESYTDSEINVLDNVFTEEEVVNLFL